nr:hypothetical protein [Nostoc sp. ChiSLP01]
MWGVWGERELILPHPPTPPTPPTPLDFSQVRNPGIDFLQKSGKVEGEKGCMFGIFPFPNKDESLFPQECKKQLIARDFMSATHKEQ